MEKERKEEKTDIVVLDKGMDPDALGGPGPEYACCWVSLMPFRS